MKPLSFLCTVALLATIRLHAATGSALTGDVVIDTRDWTLSITSPVNGTISGAGLYLNGTNATVTATPSAGYLFGGSGFFPVKTLKSIGAG